jgi:hypothetical protein
MHVNIMYMIVNSVYMNHICDMCIMDSINMNLILFDAIVVITLCYVLYIY